MDPNLRWLRLEQIQTQLDQYSVLHGHLPPRDGWLKTIREAIGRSQRQQAARLGMSGPAVHQAEFSESDGRITLGQLRKFAAALDCELVYTLVPKCNLTEQVENQARLVALRELLPVIHTMELENQQPDDSFISRQIDWRVGDLLRGRWSNLWREAD